MTFFIHMPIEKLMLIISTDDPGLWTKSLR